MIDGTAITTPTKYDPGGTNWKLGKGKPPLDPTVDLWKEYLNLWRRWSLLPGNDKLLDELEAVARRLYGGVISDRFATTPVNQAHALCELINERNAMNKITIGLDYDGTVTSDPETFKAIVRLLKAQGHIVYIVTMRYMSECKRDPAFMAFAKESDGVFATGRQAKRPYLESMGLKVHVWIDDNPIAVEKSAIEIWGVASTEGTVVTEVHDNSGVSFNKVITNEGTKTEQTLSKLV